MPILVATIIAPIGAWVHLRRHPEPRTHAQRMETYLLWWFALAIGFSGVLGGLYHVFDGKQIAEQIGFTRGDGGFQFENAMGDIAIGVAAFLCLRYRDPSFWLAVLIIATIQYWGDAIGHVYQWRHYDNTDPDNVGVPLVLDVIVPIVAWVLYRGATRERRPARG
jgi:hypothetical protein